MTASLMLAVYAIVGGNQAGWGSAWTLGLLALALVAFLAFMRIEARAEAPLIPPHLFQSRVIVASNVVGVLWAAAMFAWFFISALYLQRVLGYTPLQVGLSFLPANLIMAAFSLGLSGMIVLRFGIRRPLCLGLASGVVNTSFMMGGALGLAILASLAQARSEGLPATVGGTADRPSGLASDG